MPYILYVTVNQVNGVDYPIQGRGCPDLSSLGEVIKATIENAEKSCLDNTDSTIELIVLSVVPSA